MVRADKHNALHQAMFEGLMNAAGQLADDASVRAVVLHGEGKSFCSGLDIASFMSGRGAPAFCWSATATGWPTSLSAWPTTGPWCRRRSSPRCTGIASAAAYRSRWALISATTAKPKRSLPPLADQSDGRERHEPAELDVMSTPF
jgi:Enoyl-CoA hydratase/isomerase